MTIKRIKAVALAAAVLACAVSAPAWPRIWKGGTRELARDYVTINDTRANGEFVLLMWFVPEILASDAPGAATVKPLLDKYVIMMAVHAKLDRTTGRLSFDDIGTLDAKDQSGKPLTLIVRNDLQPTATAMLAGLEAMFRQSAGAMGAGMKVFVFDAAGVNSCKPGGLAVPLAGETYTWQTPIPRCSGS